MSRDLSRIHGPILGPGRVPGRGAESWCPPALASARSADSRQSRAGLSCLLILLMGGAVMAGPGDEKAAAAGRSRLRASHADRELTVDTLKVAFVQGRL